MMLFTISSTTALSDHLYHLLLHCICICIELRSAISLLNDWLTEWLLIDPSKSLATVSNEGRSVLCRLWRNNKESMLLAGLSSNETMTSNVQVLARLHLHWSFVQDLSDYTYYSHLPTTSIYCNCLTLETVEPRKSEFSLKLQSAELTVDSNIISNVLTHHIHW